MHAAMMHDFAKSLAMQSRLHQGTREQVGGPMHTDRKPEVGRGRPWSVGAKLLSLSPTLQVLMNTSKV